MNIRKDCIAADGLFVCDLARSLRRTAKRTENRSLIIPHDVCTPISLICSHTEPFHVNDVAIDATDSSGVLGIYWIDTDNIRHAFRHGLGTELGRCGAVYEDLLRSHTTSIDDDPLEAGESIAFVRPPNTGSYIVKRGWTRNTALVQVREIRKGHGSILSSVPAMA